jgi:flagellin
MQTAMGAIGDAQNLFSNMDGGLQQIQNILVQMSQKAMSAKGDTIGTNERAAISQQLQAYATELNSVVAQTTWNSTGLLGGSGSAGGNSGPTAAGGTTFNFLTDGTGGTTAFQFKQDSTSGVANFQGFAAVGTGGSVADSTGLGLTTAVLTITDSATATQAAANITTALNIVKGGISQEGAFSARLNFKQQAHTVQDANTQAAYNRIMNANMAQEQVDASKLTILQQTSTAMLAQANSSPQYLLKLFQ